MFRHFFLKVLAVNWTLPLSGLSHCCGNPVFWILNVPDLLLLYCLPLCCLNNDCNRHSLSIVSQQIKTQWLKTPRNIYNPHGFCVKIRELHGWAAIVAQGLSRGRSQNAHQDDSHLKAWVGPEYLLPRWLLHDVGKLVEAFSSKPPFLST